MTLTLKRRSRAADDDHQRALFEAACGGQEKGMHEAQLLRERSWYVEAMRRPTATALGILATAACVMGRRRMARAR